MTNSFSAALANGRISLARWRTILWLSTVAILGTDRAVGQLREAGRAREQGEERTKRVAEEGPGREQIAVEVVDSEGRPIEGAEVCVRAMSAESKAPTTPSVRVPGSRWSSPVVTDAEGKVSIAELGDADGPWRVTAGRTPAWSFAYSEPVGLGASVRLTLEELPQDRLIAGILQRPDGTPGRGILRLQWSELGQPKSKYVHADGQGRFTMLLRRPGIAGDLLATGFGDRFGSQVSQGVEAGQTDVVVRLRPRREFELYVVGLGNRLLDDSRVDFFWELAGHRYRDYPGPRRERGQPWRWEVPSVPFWIEIQSARHHARTLGPLDPAEIGETLRVELEPLAVLRGRVTHAGSPVEGARVDLTWKRPAGDDQRGWRGHGRTDENGSFELVVNRAGRFDLNAWRDPEGGGVLGDLVLDPETLGDSPELAVELDRAPGSIQGRVILPAGISPETVWLTSNRHDGYMALDPNGNFELTGLPSGPHSVLVRSGWNHRSGPMQDEQSWFILSHGPSLAPAWMEYEPAFFTTVKSGEATHLDLDLGSPPVAALRGALLLNGQVPVVPDQEPGLYSSPAPRVTLLAKGSGEPSPLGNDYIARAELSPDGTFLLGVPSPGEYVLLGDTSRRRSHLEDLGERPV